MTRTSDSRSLHPRLRRWGVILIHTLIYLWLVDKAYILDEMLRVIIIAGLQGQCSAATIVAAAEKKLSPVRFSVPWFAAFLCWYGISRTLLWGHGEPDSVWWVLTIVSQVTVTLIGVRVWQRFARGSAESTGQPNVSSLRSYQFPIKTLIAWTTIAAVGYALALYGTRSGRWELHSLTFVECVVTVLIGSVIAITGVATAAALHGPDRKTVCLRFLALVPVIVFMGWLIHLGADWMDLNPSSRPGLMIALLAVHSATVAITLAILDPADSKGRSTG